MSAENAYLALMLDAPLQSWGFASRFQRRTTGLHPTKSGVIGMICAAMGIGKGTGAELEVLAQLTALKMISIAITRDYRRLEDFHTVQGTRKASGAPNRDPVVTHRQYLTDARFGVVLSGERGVVGRVATALQDPVWGIWFGRKNCVPAGPVFRGVFALREQAVRCLINESPLENFTRVEDVDSFSEGTDSYTDQPVSFGQYCSSSEGRQYSLRQIKLVPGSGGKDADL